MSSPAREVSTDADTTVTAMLATTKQRKFVATQHALRAVVK